MKYSVLVAAALAFASGMSHAQNPPESSVSEETTVNSQPEASGEGTTIITEENDRENGTETEEGSGESSEKAEGGEGGENAGEGGGGEGGEGGGGEGGESDGGGAEADS